MRKVIVLIVLLLLGAVPVAAGGGRTVMDTHFEFDVDFSGPVDYCDFPLLTALHEHHSFNAQYKDLPEGLTPDNPTAVAYQIFGQHFIDFREIITNPSNGRVLEARGATRLIRRDWDTSNLTFGPNGEWNGTITAVDHVSGSIVITVPGQGTVFLNAGHVRLYHTSFYVDDVRVARLDIPFFASGPYRDQFCPYLAGN